MSLLEDWQMFCRLPGKLSTMGKELYFTCSTQFQELRWFFSFTFSATYRHFTLQNSLCNYQRANAILPDPHAHDNQWKTQATFRTKNRICNLHKMTSCGISLSSFFKLAVSDERSLVATLPTIGHVAFGLFQFVFIYALEGIYFLPPYFHRAAFTNKNVDPRSAGRA